MSKNSKIILHPTLQEGLQNIRILQNIQETFLPIVNAIGNNLSNNEFNLFVVYPQRWISDPLGKDSIFTTSTLVPWNIQINFWLLLYV